MADFERYAPILKSIEGGYADHPADKGGPTKAGVTLKVYQYYYGKDKTAQDLKNMTDEEWSRIMKVYWDECKGDEIRNQSIADIVVDWNINSGLAGRKGVQEALGLTVDGAFGPKTLKALNGDPQKCVFCKIRDAREHFFVRLVEKNPSQAVFLKGWLNRLKRFEFDNV